MFTQPPLGGCVLKLSGNYLYCPLESPAAFRRLCVETTFKAIRKSLFKPSRL